MRSSVPTSGWNDVAINGPCRTATILPTASPVATRASTSTSGPADSTHGARMNTRVTGSSSPAKSTSPSNESTWRPKALRRTVMSSPPRVSWPAVPSSIRSASRIIPAQVPNVGIPCRDPLLQRLEQVEDAGQLGHRGGLTAGDDEPVAGVELRGPAYGQGGDAERLEGREVLAHVALQGEDADARRSAVHGRHGTHTSPGGVPPPRRHPTGTRWVDRTEAMQEPS